MRENHSKDKSNGDSSLPQVIESLKGNSQSKKEIKPSKKKKDKKSKKKDRSIPEFIKDKTHRIEEISVDDLKKPDYHNKEFVNDPLLLKTSLKKHGILNLLVVNEREGCFYVLDGNLVLEILIENGIKSVRCVVLNEGAKSEFKIYKELDRQYTTALLDDLDQMFEAEETKVPENIGGGNGPTKRRNRVKGISCSEEQYLSLCALMSQIAELKGFKTDHEILIYSLTQTLENEKSK